MSAHAGFAAGLLQPLQPAPSGWHGRAAQDGELRYAVYRNNVTHALVGAFEAAYPVLRALLGAGCFAQLARDCARAQPPRTPVLSEYVAVLPAFIATTSLLAELPYLRDVGWLEATCLRVYHAADATPLSAAAWRALRDDPQHLASAVLQLHPACDWRACTHAAADIWLAHRRVDNPELAEMADVDVDAPQDVVVWRDCDDRVRVTALPSGSASVFDALAAGTPLLQALAGVPAQTCAAVLAQLAEAGMVLALRSAPAAEARQ